MKSEAIDISIIIPAYQAERTIERAIVSATAFQRISVEVLVVNDGSTDHTANVVEHIQRGDPRVFLLEQPNKGRSAARNKGVEVSRGNWVMFVDADDYLVSGVESIIESALKREHDDLSLFIFGMLYKGDRSRFTSAIPEETEVISRRSNDRILAADLASGMVNGTWRNLVENSNSYQIDACWARLYRRESLNQLKGRLPNTWEPFPLRVRFSEDRLFNLAFLQSNPTQNVEFLSTPIYNWDYDESSTAAVIEDSDIDNLPDFFARANEAAECGLVNKTVADGLVGSQAIEQFRRVVVNPAGFNLTTRLVKNWELALTSKDVRACLLATPKAFLGKGGLWRLAAILLYCQRVKLAFSLYGAMFRLKRTLMKSGANS